MIVNKSGEIFLVKSPKWFGRYVMPGGHIELGETIEEALEREVKEEAGLKIKVVKLLRVQQAIYSKEFWKPRHFIFFNFLCRLVGSPKAKVDRREVQDFVWIMPRKALKMKLDSFTRKTIQAYLKSECELFNFTVYPSVSYEDD